MAEPLYKLYLQKVTQVAALQYITTNWRDMLTFGGGKITYENPVLYLQSIPEGKKEVINNTDWVYVDPWRNMLMINNHDFGLTYELKPVQPTGNEVAGP